jgi:uncharacterized protein DUF6159
MGTLGRTWELYKQSFAVLNADVEIVLFPVMSAISVVLLAASFLIPFYQSGSLAAMAHHSGSWDDYVVLFGWYYLNYFIVIFFNSALVGCANIRLLGGNPRVRDGMRIAARHMSGIASWALVAATAGIILSTLRGRRNLLGRLLAPGLGLAWTLVTYLIVPVIILEERGAFEAIQRSTDLFKKRWGEEVAGSFGFGLLTLLLLLPGLLLAALIFRLDRALAIIIGVWYVAILAAITSAAKGIFTVALYRYAAVGDPPVGFSADLIDRTLKPR